MFILQTVKSTALERHVFHVIMATTHPNSIADTNVTIPAKLALILHPATSVHHLHHLVTYQNFVHAQLAHSIMGYLPSVAFINRRNKNV